MPRLDRLTPPDPGGAGTGTRLSASPLWPLQRRFFERAGPAAWADDTVPHYVTNNAGLAAAYAEVLLGWLRDAGPLDGGQPLTVVEIGAGSGRFAFSS